MARGGTAEQRREKGLARWRGRDTKAGMVQVRRGIMLKQLRELAPDLADQLETRIAANEINHNAKESN